MFVLFYAGSIYMQGSYSDFYNPYQRIFPSTKMQQKLQNTLGMQKSPIGAALRGIILALDKFPPTEKNEE